MSCSSLVLTNKKFSADALAMSIRVQGSVKVYTRDKERKFHDIVSSYLSNQRQSCLLGLVRVKICFIVTSEC